jgi:hypothetical protein
MLSSRRSLQLGRYQPVSWPQAAISAVFRKGDPACKEHYRGIAVGNVLGKVFNMVLEQRLSAWADEHGHRAQGTGTGRLSERHENHKLFNSLRCVLNKYQLQKQQLFCCFVDFKKAYDSVDRKLLLQRLASLGVWGQMLTSVAAMYNNVHLQARVGGKVGPASQLQTGVKQGDPLSLLNNCLACLLLILLLSKGASWQIEYPAVVPVLALVGVKCSCMQMMWQRQFPIYSPS